jgi:hypothetical protein
MMWASTEFTTEPAESTEMFPFIFSLARRPGWAVGSVLSVVNDPLAHPFSHSPFRKGKVPPKFYGIIPPLYKERITRVAGILPRTGNICPNFTRSRTDRCVPRT